MAITIHELATLCGATLQGNHSHFQDVITCANDIAAAKTGQVTQLTQASYRHFAQSTQASACFLKDDFDVQEVPDSLVLLRCADPEKAFIHAVTLLHPQTVYSPTISPQAMIAKTAVLARNVHIGAFATLDEHTEVGENTAILTGACIGRQVKIGKNCIIYPYAVLYDDVELGNNVIIHSGAIIGADGFGYKFRDGAHLKVPQVGNVVIGDNVEIGANTCVDRGALGSTTIGVGSKIDNLVQIGHNNKIGQHVIVCGQAGISGSCTIDNYAILAGSAGIADHVNIGQGAVVMARAGVANNVAAKTQVFGSPAKEKRIAYREQIAIAQLPDLMKKIKQLEERLCELTAKNNTP
ncbi:MAG: UDP-3-O-[3-hydroxymyristoyl] glucosamine N-acyltransferase [Pseudomonadota bacterium]|nr:UDP-3-O-[3-hydroxymyristoyl] glucosamine N-acyltransferase [Pseudomonadota bacterium]